MKKVLSVLLVSLLVVLTSVVTFAESSDVVDNAVQEVPVSIRQEFIDETPEGQFLVNVVYTQLSEHYYQYEALYLPLAQPISASIQGTKYIRIYYDGLPNIHIMYYQLTGTFTVPYDGTAATCTRLTYRQQYIYDNENGYHFAITDEDTSYIGNAGRLTIYYNAYWDGSYVESEVGYGSIACDPYGEIY